MWNQLLLVLRTRPASLRDQALAAQPVKAGLQLAFGKSGFAGVPVFTHFTNDLVVGWRMAIDQKVIPGGKEGGDIFDFFGGLKREKNCPLVSGSRFWYDSFKVRKSSKYGSFDGACARVAYPCGRV
jgi:hypothetical protein